VFNSSKSSHIAKNIKNVNSYFLHYYSR